MFIVYIQVV